MSFPAIDWATPAASLLTAINNGGGFDPFGAIQVRATLVQLGAMYDDSVARAAASVARNNPPAIELSTAARDAEFTPTARATDPNATQMMVTDFLTRLVAQANILIAAAPWTFGNRPAGLKVGWPWI